ncbi:MAG: flagellar protein FlgN [Gammaproteobacteria bacterium]|nr:flagellar protein FlgN [Gammaproteobacteria bacterium]MDH5652970.1 flagellar protein FlgN [Gammaproteobacteria bacterium]
MNLSRLADLELLLRDMYEALSELAMVLENEHHALETTDVDKLHQAAVRKEGLSDKLEKLEQQRVALLSRANKTPDKESMLLFIDEAAGNRSESMHSIWQMVEELAVRCDTQNRINGIVIENSKRQTQAALAILRGHLTAEDKLYGADGGTVSQVQNSSLARA